MKNWFYVCNISDIYHYFDDICPCRLQASYQVTKFLLWRSPSIDIAWNNYLAIWPLVHKFGYDNIRSYLKVPCVSQRNEQKVLILSTGYVLTAKLIANAKMVCARLYVMKSFSINTCSSNELTDWRNFYVFQISIGIFLMENARLIIFVQIFCTNWYSNNLWGHTFSVLSAFPFKWPGL